MATQEIIVCECGKEYKKHLMHSHRKHCPIGKLTLLWLLIKGDPKEIIAKLLDFEWTKALETYQCLEGVLIDF